MTDLAPATRILLAALMWAVLIVILYRATLLSKHRTTGLPLAYVLATTLFHCGGLVHLNPSYDHNANRYLLSWNYTSETVAAGIEASTLGILGIVAGIKLANLVRVGGGFYQPYRQLPLLSQSRLILGISSGAILFGLLARGIIASLPGFSAILWGFNGIFLLGVCGLILHYSGLSQVRNVILTVFFGVCAVIGLQMLTFGILGDSTAGAITILAFSLVMFKPSLPSMLKGLISLTAVAYLLLVAAVGWLDIRSEIRSAVWNNESLSDRASAFASAVSTVEIFDGSFQGHLEFLDTRMNHNVMVGKAIEQLSRFPDLSANGETLLLAAFGWVPRALWPGKPERGGVEMAALYTGQDLSGNSAFGTGPIFEFFINFRWWGVLIGCIFYGFVLRLLDIKSARLLASGNIVRAGPFFAAGAAMVAPMNSLFFIVNGVISSAIAGGISIYLARRMWSRTAQVVTARPPLRRD